MGGEGGWSVKDVYVGAHDTIFKKYVCVYELFKLQTCWRASESWGAEQKQKLSLRRGTLPDSRVGTPAEDNSSEDEPESETWTYSCWGGASQQAE